MSKVYMLNVGYSRIDSPSDTDHIGLINDLSILDTLYRKKIKSNERIKTVSLNSDNNRDIITEYLKYFENLMDDNTKTPPAEKQIFILTINCHSYFNHSKSETFYYIGQGETSFSIYNKSLYDISKLATIFIFVNSCEVNFGSDQRILSLINSEEKPFNTAKINEKIAELQQAISPNNEFPIKKENDYTILDFNIYNNDNKLTENNHLTLPIIKLANLKTTYTLENNINNITPGTYVVKLLDNIISKEIFITYAELINEMHKKLESIYSFKNSSKPYIEVLTPNIKQYSTIKNFFDTFEIMQFVAFEESEYL